MKYRYTHMIVINLHETDHLEEVLKYLAEEYARETIIIDVEGIKSRHGNSFPNIALLLSLFKESSNKNIYISALLEEKRINDISQKLSGITVEDRYAASFWFIPIQNYFYHKREIPDSE